MDSLLVSSKVQSLPLFHFFLYYGDFVKTDALCDGRCEVGDWSGNAFSDIFLSLFFFKNLCSK